METTPLTPIEPSGTPLPPTPPLPQAPAPTPPLPPAPQQPAPKKKSAAPWIILSSVVGGVIILALIGLVLYFVVFAVTPKDYQQAATKSDAVTAKITAAEDAVTSSMTNLSSTSTTADITAKIADAQTSLDSLQSATQGLASLKALHDADVKKAYDAYISKYDTFSTYMNNFLVSYKKIAPAIADANVVSNDSDQSAKLADAQKVQTELASAENVPDKDFATYAHDAAAAYQSIIDATQAYNQATTYAELDTAQNDYYTALTQLEDVSNTFESNAQKHAQAVDPSPAYNTYIDVINSKLKAS